MKFYLWEKGALDEAGYSYTVKERNDKSKSLRCRRCRHTVWNLSASSVNMIGRHGHVPVSFYLEFLKFLNTSDKDLSFEELYNSLRGSCSSVGDVLSFVSAKKFLSCCWHRKANITIISSSQENPNFNASINAKSLSETNDDDHTSERATLNKKEKPNFIKSLKDSMKPTSETDGISRNRVQKNVESEFQKRLKELLTQKTYTLYNVYSILCDEFGADICNRKYQQTFISLSKIQSLDENVPDEGDEPVEKIKHDYVDTESDPFDVDSDCKTKVYKSQSFRTRDSNTELASSIRNKRTTTRSSSTNSKKLFDGENTNKTPRTSRYKVSTKPGVDENLLQNEIDSTSLKEEENSLDKYYRPMKSLVEADRSKNETEDTKKVSTEMSNCDSLSSVSGNKTDVQSKVPLLTRWKQILSDSDGPFLKQFSILESEYDESLCAKQKLMCQELWKLSQGTGAGMEESTENSKSKRRTRRVTFFEFKKKALSLLSGSAITLVALSDSLKKEFGLAAWRKYQDVAESLWSEKRNGPKKSKQTGVSEQRLGNEVVESNQESVYRERFENEMNKILAGPRKTYHEVVKMILTKVDVDVYKKYQQLAKSMWKVSQSLDSDSTESSQQSDMDSDDAGVQPEKEFDSHLPEIQNKLYQILSEKHLPFKTLFGTLEKQFGKQVCKKYEKLCYLWWEQEDLSHQHQQLVIESAIREMEQDLRCSDNDTTFEKETERTVKKNMFDTDDLPQMLHTDFIELNNESLTKRFDVTKSEMPKNTGDTEKSIKTRAKSEFKEKLSDTLKETPQIDQNTGNTKKTYEKDALVNSALGQVSMEPNKLGNKSIYDKNMSKSTDESDTDEELLENKQKSEKNTTDSFQTKFLNFSDSHKDSELDSDSGKDDFGAGGMNDLSYFFPGASKSQLTKGPPSNQKKRKYACSNKSSMSDLQLSDDSDSETDIKTSSTRTRPPVRKRQLDQPEHIDRKIPKLFTNSQEKKLRNSEEGHRLNTGKEDSRQKTLNCDSTVGSSHEIKQGQADNSFSDDIEEQVTKHIVEKPKPEACPEVDQNESKLAEKIEKQSKTNTTILKRHQSDTNFKGLCTFNEAKRRERGSCQDEYELMGLSTKLIAPHQRQKITKNLSTPKFSKQKEIEFMNTGVYKLQPSNESLPSSRRGDNKSVVPSLPKSKRPYVSSMKAVSLKEAYTLLSDQDSTEDVDSNKETLVFDQFVSNMDSDQCCCLTFVSPSVIEIVKGLPYADIDLHIDWSFRIKPQFGSEMCLIMVNAFVRGECFPLLWALATAPNKNSFMLILLQIKTIVPKINSVIIDVCEDLKEAAEVIYPKVQLRGIWFYFAKSLYLEAEELGILSEDDDTALNIVERALTVSLMPLQEMENGIQLLTTYILEKSYTKTATFGFLHFLSQLTSTYTKHFQNYLRKYNASQIFKDNFLKFLNKKHSNTWSCIQDLLQLEVIDYSEIKMGIKSSADFTLPNAENYKDFMEKEAETILNKIAPLVGIKKLVKDEEMALSRFSHLDRKIGANEVETSHIKSAKNTIEHKPTTTNLIMTNDRYRSNSTAEKQIKKSILNRNQTQETSRTKNSVDNRRLDHGSKSTPSIKRNTNPSTRMVPEEKISRNIGIGRNSNSSTTNIAEEDARRLGSTSLQNSVTIRPLEKSDCRPVGRNVAVIAPNNDLMTDAQSLSRPKMRVSPLKKNSIDVSTIMESLENRGVTVNKIKKSSDLEPANTNAIEFLEEEEEEENIDNNKLDDASSLDNVDFIEDDEIEYEGYECLEDYVNQVTNDCENTEFEGYETLDTEENETSVSQNFDFEGEDFQEKFSTNNTFYDLDESFEAIDDTMNYERIQEVDENGFSVITYVPKENIEAANVPNESTTVVRPGVSIFHPQKTLPKEPTRIENITSTPKINSRSTKTKKIQILNQTVLGHNDARFALKRGPNQELKICGVFKQEDKRRSLQDFGQQLSVESRPVTALNTGKRGRASSSKANILRKTSLVNKAKPKEYYDTADLIDILESGVIDVTPGSNVAGKSEGMDTRLPNSANRISMSCGNEDMDISLVGFDHFGSPGTNESLEQLDLILTEEQAKYLLDN